MRVAASASRPSSPRSSLTLCRAAATTTGLQHRPRPGRLGRSRPSWAPAGCSTPEDIAQPSNATRTVDCDEPHTAETYAVGELPDELQDAEYESGSSAPSPTRRARERFKTFLGADESLVMRTVVSWAWFRPVGEGVGQGARWYRCDIVGGGEQSKRFVDLPDDRQGPAAGQAGGQVDGLRQRRLVSSSAPKIPCTEPHDWRAVTTIKVGQPEDPYPGDRLVEVHHPRLLLRLGGRLAGLPARVRLRLHVVPPGRVEGGQPPLGLLGEDHGVTPLSPRSCCSSRLALAGLLRRRRASPRPRRRRPPPDDRRAADRRRPPPPPAPSGSCRRLSYDEALAPTDSDRSSAARQPHTGGRTPSGARTVVGGHLVAVDSARVQEQVAAGLPAQAGGVPRRHADDALRLTMLRPSGSRPASSSPTPGRTGTAATSSRSPATTGWRGSAARSRGPRRPPTARTTACAARPPPDDPAFRRVLCRGGPHLARDPDGRPARQELPRREAGPRGRPGAVRGRRPRGRRRRARLRVGLRVAHGRAVGGRPGLRPLLGARLPRRPRSDASSSPPRCASSATARC